MPIHLTGLYAYAMIRHTPKIWEMEGKNEINIQARSKYQRIRAKSLPVRNHPRQQSNLVILLSKRNLRTRTLQRSKCNTTRLPLLIQVSKVNDVLRDCKPNLQRR